MNGKIKKINGIFPVTVASGVYLDNTNKTLKQAIDNGGGTKVDPEEIFSVDEETSTEPFVLNNGVSPEDFEPYQKKQDDSLNTIDKTIVGSINECVYEISKLYKENEYGEIDAMNIKDFSIMPINTNFFDLDVDYTNKLNIERSITGLLDSTNGNLVNKFDTFSSILYIPVEENTDYIFSNDNLVAINLSSICYYGYNKNFISAVTNVNKFTTPSGTKFISVSIFGKFNTKAQLEKGTINTPYKPFKKIIRNNGIKEEYLNKVIGKINSVETGLSGIFEYRSLNWSIEKGYYDVNKFFPNASYDSIKTDCEPGDKFKITCFMLGISKLPVARFYNKSFVEISNTGRVTQDTKFTDYEIIIPDNVSFMTVSCSNTNDVNLELKKRCISTSLIPQKSTSGLKFISIGDSITAQSDRWRDQFIAKTGAKEIMCTAVAGAHLADYNDTNLDGEDFSGHGNTICNQIKKIINNPPVETPDFIIISAGTNDTLGTDVLDKDTNVFIGEDGATYSDINTIDRTLIEGAMRWQTEKIYELFPNVIIFYASPIQAFEGIRATWNILKKEDKIIRIARKMSVQVIKAGSRSGIYGRYENRDANGKYLIDGLHPNKEGGIKLGNYYASQVIKYYNYL